MSETTAYKTLTLTRDEWLVYFAALDNRIEFLKARIEADPAYFAWREQLATAKKMFAELHE